MPLGIIAKLCERGANSRRRPASNSRQSSELSFFVYAEDSLSLVFVAANRVLLKSILPRTAHMQTSAFVTKSLFAYDASESRLPLIKKDWVHSQSFLIYAKIETRTLLMFSFQDKNIITIAKKFFTAFVPIKLLSLNQFNI